MDISVYSFTAVAQRAEKLMNEGGSLLTMTYYGAEKVMPNYNVMGVAKAALEARRDVSRRRSRQTEYPGQCNFSRPDQDPLLRRESVISGTSSNGTNTTLH